MTTYKNRAERRAAVRKQGKLKTIQKSASAVVAAGILAGAVAGPVNASDRQTPEGYVSGTTITDAVKEHTAAKKKDQIDEIAPDAAGAAAFVKAGVSIDWDQAVVESNKLSQQKADGSLLPVVAIPTPVIDEAKAFASTPASSHLIDSSNPLEPKAVYLNGYGTNITTPENIAVPDLKAGEIAEGYTSLNEATPFGNDKVGTGNDVGNDPSQVQIPAFAFPTSSIRDGGISSSDGLNADVSHTVFMDARKATPEHLAELKADGTQTGHNLATLVDCTVVGTKCGFFMQVMAQGTGDGSAYVTTAEGDVTRYASEAEAYAAGIPENASILVDDSFKRIPLTAPIWINVKTSLHLDDSDATSEATAFVAENGDKFWTTQISAAAEAGAGHALSPATRYYPSRANRGTQTASIDFNAAFDGNSFSLNKVLNLSGSETGVSHSVRYGVDANGKKIEGLTFGSVDYRNTDAGTAWITTPTAEGVNEVKGYLATYAITDSRYKTVAVSDELKAGKTFTAPNGAKATVKVVSVREADPAVYPFNSAATVDVLVTFDSMPTDSAFTFATDTPTGLAASVSADPTGIGTVFMPGKKLQYKVADNTGTIPAGTPDAVSSKGETVNVSLKANDKAGAGRVIIDTSYLLKDPADGKFKKAVILSGKGKVKVLDNGSADFTPEKGYTGGFPTLDYWFATAPVGLGMEDAPAESAGTLFANAGSKEATVSDSIEWYANGPLEDERGIVFNASKVNAEATRASVKAVGTNAYESTITGIKGDEVFGAMNYDTMKFEAYKAGDKFTVSYNNQSVIPAGEAEVDANGVVIDNRLTATVVSNTAGALKVRFDMAGGIAGAPVKALNLSFKEAPRYKGAFSTLALSASGETTPAPAAAPDKGVGKYGTPVDMPVLANDTKSGESYAIVTGSIFLKDASGAEVKSFSISGQGTYEVIDAENIVRFTPVDGFSGKADAVSYVWTERDSATGAENTAGSTAQAEILPEPVITTIPKNPVPDTFITEEFIPEDESDGAEGEITPDLAETGAKNVGWLLGAGGLVGAGGLLAGLGTLLNRRRKNA